MNLFYLVNLNNKTLILFSLSFIVSFSAKNIKNFEKINFFASKIIFFFLHLLKVNIII